MIDSSRLILAVAGLLLLAPSAVRAEPAPNPCAAWLGTARVWTTVDATTGETRPMTLRECGGVPKAALAYAQRCMEKFGDRLASKKHVIIGDFSTDANFVRLYVLEWQQQDPQASIPLLRGGLAQGVGNDPATVTGAATIVSDRWGSNATPGGCLRLFGTGDEATLQSVAQNLQAYRLDGLEERNACAYPRGIYFHESYLAQNGVDKVKTRRYEELDQKDPHAADFSRIKRDRNLGTAITPGCITASNDDFDFIKASGFVPPPGRGWNPTTPARAKEGILFVSWFWGDNEEQAPVSRYERKPRSCFDPVEGMTTRAIPRSDGMLKALEELESWQK